MHYTCTHQTYWQHYLDSVKAFALLIGYLTDSVQVPLALSDHPTIFESSAAVNIEEVASLEPELLPFLDVASLFKFPTANLR